MINPIYGTGAGRQDGVYTNSIIFMTNIFVLSTC